MINTDVKTIWSHNDGTGPTTLGKLCSVIKTIIELLKGLFSREQVLRPGRMMNTSELQRALEWLDLSEIDIQPQIVQRNGWWERNHIVVTINYKDKTEFYDAKGYLAAEYGIKVDKQTRQNGITEQFDCFNCGVHIIYHLYKTYKPDAREFHDINAFRRFLAKEISRTL